MFSLLDEVNFIQISCIKKEKEVYHRQEWLCGFGDDLFILGNCNKQTNNWSSLGRSYEKLEDDEG